MNLTKELCDLLTYSQEKNIDLGGPAGLLN